MSDKTLTLSISVDHTNLILEALGQLPFVKVFELIGEIQGQAKRQLGDDGPPRPTAVPPVEETSEGS